MKTKSPQNNNPAVVGALIAVLVVTVSLIVLKIRALASPAAPAVTPVAAAPVGTATPVETAPATPAAPGATATADTPAPVAIQPPRSERNPFRPSAPEERPKTAPARAGRDRLPLPRLPRLADGTPPRGYTRPPVLPPAFVTPGPSAPPAPRVDYYAAEREQVARFRLSAIIGSAERRAVIETDDAPAAVLRIGDRFHSFQVVAVHATEVVLSGAHGLYTLPLSAPEPPAETRAASAESALPTQENPNAPK